jgi:ribonuclease HII
LPQACNEVEIIDNKCGEPLNTMATALPKAIAGIDEAGRGPLAGPVVAAAVILNPNCPIKGLGDSKTISAKRREALAGEIMNYAQVGLGVAEPAEIDRVNILQATMIAMRRAINNLPVMPDHALIDGNRVPELLDCTAEAIIKGDAKEACIGAASIIAKTVRDRLMVGAALRFPAYGFDGHKGYPSAMHRAALAELGPCPIHRMSYAPVRLAHESGRFRAANHCG